jgi:hypothetical protein
MTTTTYSSVSVLMAIPITASMLTAGTTIAEPDLSLGEAMWVSAGTYAVGAERISNHKVYSCVQAHSGRTALPESDPDYWLFKRPSNLFAPFDFYRSTAAKATGSLTYKAQPGFFRDVRLFGAVGDQVQITARDTPGGTVMKQTTQDLWEQALGFWELLFKPLGLRSTVDLSDIPISPTAELTVTVSAGPAAPVALGTLIVGEWVSLTGGTGGTEYGSKAEPRSYSYIKFYDDGTFEIKRRPGATDLSMSAVLDADQAEYTVALLQEVLDVPIAISATNVPGYGYLSAFGLINGTVTPTNKKDAQLDVRVKGII